MTRLDRAVIYDVYADVYPLQQPIGSLVAS